MTNKKIGKTDWYHQQWGNPTYDDSLLFELLTVGVFQVGLSWKVVTGKRTVFNKHFLSFDIQKVAALFPDDIEKILLDTEMIRNPRKVEATITNAQAILTIQKEFGSFSNYLWQFIGNQPIMMTYTEEETIPNNSPTSTSLAKELKRRGFKFVGPTVTYMFMKASGLVKDVRI